MNCVFEGSIHVGLLVLIVYMNNLHKEEGTNILIEIFADDTKAANEINHKILQDNSIK